MWKAFQKKHKFSSVHFGPILHTGPVSLRFLGSEAIGGEESNRPGGESPTEWTARRPGLRNSSAITSSGRVGMGSNCTRCSKSSLKRAYKVWQSKPIVLKLLEIWTLSGKPWINAMSLDSGLQLLKGKWLISDTASSPTSAKLSQIKVIKSDKNGGWKSTIIEKTSCRIETTSLRVAGRTNESRNRTRNSGVTMPRSVWESSSREKFNFFKKPATASIEFTFLVYWIWNKIWKKNEKNSKFWKH